jgi:putative methyltransferase (TIGR04325 family)
VNMSILKALAYAWSPPVLMDWIHQIRGGEVRFEGDFSTWEEASVRCSRYDTQEILDRVLAATLKVKRGEAAFERDSVLFDQIDYAWPMLAGLMWAGACNGGRLNVLDFGGALGSSYFQNRKFLQSLSDVRWNVVEQSHYVEAGLLHIQDERLRFYRTLEECLTENQPNVILLSSVLQYIESPNNLVDKLSKVGAKCLVIDRTPFSVYEKDRLVNQRVPAAIYSASYPMWIFSLSMFEKLLAANWSMVAVNLSPEGYVRTTEGFEFSFQGMLLAARQW